MPLILIIIISIILIILFFSLKDFIASIVAIMTIVLIILFIANVITGGTLKPKDASFDNIKTEFIYRLNKYDYFDIIPDWQMSKKYYNKNIKWIYNTIRQFN